MAEKKKAGGKKKILLAFLSLLAIAVFWGAIFLIAGKPMLAMVQDPKEFQAWVDAQGFVGKLIFVGFVILQVLVSVIPSEPLEIAGGYAFGAVEGTLLCLIGLAVGTAIIFLFVRRVGYRVVEFFIPRQKIDAIPLLHNTNRLRTVVFLLYFIPGTPKDGITWVVPLTPLALSDFILLSTVARAVSVVTSTVGGSALGEKNYTVAILAFVITALISGAGVLIYRALQKRHKKREGNKQE